MLGRHLSPTVRLTRPSVLNPNLRRKPRPLRTQGEPRNTASLTNPITEADYRLNKHNPVAVNTLFFFLLRRCVGLLCGYVCFFICYVSLAFFHLYDMYLMSLPILDLQLYTFILKSLYFCLYF